MSGTKGRVEEAHKRNLEIVRLRSTGLTWPSVAEHSDEVPRGLYPEFDKHREDGR